MKNSIWENQEFIEDYNKNFNKISKGLESLIDKEAKKLEKSIKVIEIDSDTIDYDESKLKVAFNENLKVEMPIGLLQCNYNEFNYILTSIYNRLTDNEKKLLIERSKNYIGDANDKELASNFDSLIHKGYVDGIDYKRVFFNQLQNGYYDTTYLVEEKITDELNTGAYSNKIASNNKKAKKHKKIMESKEFNSKKNMNTDTGFVGISKRETIHFELSDCSSYDSEYEELKVKPSHKTSTVEKPETIDNISVSQGSRRNKKMIKKNYINITPSTSEELLEFRKQEIERYRNPTVPYAYKLKDGEMRVVAPACKKLSDSTAKARDHYLLKPERPAVVTLLSLVRDAAAKLPNGFGTRNDICELLKESQYINTDVSEEKMSSVVSGALDRLHYEKDPCVKYDNDKKLWFYLHIGRSKEDFIEESNKISNRQKKGGNDRKKESNQEL